MATVQMTDDQFARLMEGMSNAKISTSSFSKCTARFKGCRSEAKVDEFIQTIKCYKTVENNSDGNAIQGFPLLLEDFASTWWKGIQHEAKTFEDAICLVRKHFSPVKPDYKIYMEIFRTAQQSHIPTDTFICEKRSLFSQLPQPRPTESMQIGMIFGVIYIDIPKEIKRESIKNFSDLLQKAREVEIIENERKQSLSCQATTKAQSKQCTYLRRQGHEEIDCRSKRNLKARSPTALPAKPIQANDGETANRKMLWLWCTGILPLKLSILFDEYKATTEEGRILFNAQQVWCRNSYHSHNNMWNTRNSTHRHWS